MAEAIGIFVGRFGRVALFNASEPVLEHAHSQMHILIKVGGKDCTYEIEGNRSHLTDDQMVLVNPWEAHSNPRTQDCQSTLLLAIYLEPMWFGDYGNALLIGSGTPLFPQACAPVTERTRYLSEKISVLIQDMSSDEGQLEDLLLQLKQHVIESVHSLTVSSRMPSPARGVDHRIRKAVKRMRAEFGNNLDLREIAADVGLSRSRFYQQFRSCVGVSPRLYLDTLRCELIVGLLGCREKTLAQISEQLGFSSQGHFTRFFKSKTGITPSNFRRALFEMVKPEVLQQNTDLEHDLPRP